MLKGVKCVRGYVSLEEHQRCMVEEPGPPCGIEPSLLQRMTEPNLERVKERVIFSHSTINACHRRTTLANEHDWYMDVENGYKSVRGSIIHDGLQFDGPYPGTLGVVREVRMGAPIQTKYGEQTFHGKADLIVLLNVEHVYPKEQPVNDKGELLTVAPRVVLHVKVVDYKSKSEVGHDLVEPDAKHIYQINEYAWILKQWLPGWLNMRLTPDSEDFPGWNEYAKLHLNDGVSLPYIDAVVVDELSIVYMDMKKTRTFSSQAVLYAKGKMKGTMINGRWRKTLPMAFEELELPPIHTFSDRYIEAIIRKGIEDQIEAEKLLAPPIVGDNARIICQSCPVRQMCYDIGIREGHSMEDQKSYVDRSVVEE